MPIQRIYYANNCVAHTFETDFQLILMIIILKNFGELTRKRKPQTKNVLTKIISNS